MNPVSGNLEKSIVDNPAAEAMPFAVHFQAPCFADEQAEGTNTRSMSDDDTGTFRKDTEDSDT